MGGKFHTLLDSKIRADEQAPNLDTTYVVHMCILHTDEQTTTEGFPFKRKKMESIQRSGKEKKTGEVILPDKYQQLFIGCPSHLFSIIRLIITYLE